MIIGISEDKTVNLLCIRTLQSLCEELVQQGLLKLPKNHRIQEFFGRSVCYCDI